MTHTIFRHHAPDLPESGCITTDVLDFLHPLLWQVRAEVEHDERYLQTVVYLLLFNPAGAIQSDVGFWERGHLALGCFDGKMPSLPGFWLTYHITLNRTPGGGNDKICYTFKSDRLLGYELHQRTD